MHITQSDPGAAATNPPSALSAPTMNVLSNQLVWRPMGEQGARLAACPPRVVHPDILLAKLKPGQRIKVEGWCRKGVGKDHAKFSPVCTASYRLLPRIDIVEVRPRPALSIQLALCPLSLHCLPCPPTGSDSDSVQSHPPGRSAAGGGRRGGGPGEALPDAGLRHRGHGGQRQEGWRGRAEAGGGGAACGSQCCPCRERRRRRPSVSFADGGNSGLATERHPGGRVRQGRRDERGNLGGAR